MRFMIWFSLLFGALVGLGLFTFYYADGFSYFQTAPEACANCHIMQPQLDSWRKSSHHTVAVCVDCHLPHEFFAKYLAKADNGYRHSKGFTLQDFKEPIEMSAGNRKILQKNCLRCHSTLMPGAMHAETIECVHCHAAVGHGEPLGMGKIYDDEAR